MSQGNFFVNFDYDYICSFNCIINILWKCRTICSPMNLMMMMILKLRILMLMFLWFVNDDVDSVGNDDVDVSQGNQRGSNQINDDPIEYYEYGVDTDLFMSSGSVLWIYSIRSVFLKLGWIGKRWIHSHFLYQRIFFCFVIYLCSSSINFSVYQHFIWLKTYYKALCWIFAKFLYLYICKFMT